MSIIDREVAIVKKLHDIDDEIYNLMQELAPANLDKSFLLNVLVNRRSLLVDELKRVSDEGRCK